MKPSLRHAVRCEIVRPRPQTSGRRKIRQRRGMAVLVILLLLSLTLGLSYAAMRSMSTADMIQRNSDWRVSAREAAIVGMKIALKKMQTNEWQGVGTSLSGQVAPGETFTVDYTAGDPRPSCSIDEQPYRATLLSVGRAINPLQPESNDLAIYKIRTIVELIPRKLATQPTDADWAKMKDFIVYQTIKEDVELDLPCRFEGPVRFQQRLRAARHYPNDSDARRQYLFDLYDMHRNGWSDYRPFKGPITWPEDVQESLYKTFIKSYLYVDTISKAAEEVSSSWVKPASPMTYRLYTGGPVYTAQALPDTVQSTSPTVDVATNPLHIFYREGSVNLNNVTVNGSIFCRDEVRFSGNNVKIQPVRIKPLYGTTDDIHLAAVSCQNMTISSAGGGSVTGLVSVFDKFQIDRGPATTKFTLAGKLVTRKLFILERESWTSLNWSTYYFWYQLLIGYNNFMYFPEWMDNLCDCNYKPLIKFMPGTAGTDHWATSYNPILIAHPNDKGLRWRLLSWTENM